MTTGFAVVKLGGGASAALSAKAVPAKAVLLENDDTDVEADDDTDVETGAEDLWPRVFTYSWMRSGEMRFILSRIGGCVEKL